jgi:hypothetical protein
MMTIMNISRYDVKIVKLSLVYLFMKFFLYWTREDFLYKTREMFFYIGPEKIFYIRQEKCFSILDQMDQRSFSYIGPEKKCIERTRCLFIKRAIVRVCKGNKSLVSDRI